MKRVLIPKGGNDVVMTPIKLTKKIINHYNPTGKCLEPAKGTGNFYKFMPKNSDWCEISENKDFFNYQEKVDWIITNPPFSLFRKFLIHSMQISENIVYLCTINHIWLKARLRDIKEYGFGINEIILINTPITFPQSGFQVGIIYLKKTYKNKINLLDWR